jgi:zinc finger protein 830
MADPQQLRQLMKEKEREKREGAKKIESPLARYNNLGQLVCKVCSLVLKSDALWQPHCASKKHRENLEALRDAKQQQQQQHQSAATSRAATVAPVVDTVEEAVKPAEKLPSGFFDDARKQKASEASLGQKAGGAADIDAGPEPETDANGVPTSSASLEAEFAKFQKQLAAVEAPPMIPPPQPQTAEEEPEEDIEEEVKHLQEAQRTVRSRFEELKRKALEEKAEALQTKRARQEEKPRSSEEPDAEEDSGDDLLDWRTKKL